MPLTSPIADFGFVFKNADLWTFYLILNGGLDFGSLYQGSPDSDFLYTIRYEQYFIQSYFFPQFKG